MGGYVRDWPIFLLAKLVILLRLLTYYKIVLLCSYFVFSDPI